MERAWTGVQLRGHPGPDSSLTGLESGSLERLGEAWRCSRGAENGGVFRQIEGALWRGETASDRGSAGRSWEGWGWGWGEGAWGEPERCEPEPGPSGNSLPLGPAPGCAQVHLSLPRALRCSRARRNVLQMFVASLPPGVPRGSASARAKSAVGRSPFPRWVRGIFLSAFSSST